MNPFMFYHESKFFLHAFHTGTCQKVLNYTENMIANCFSYAYMQHEQNFSKTLISHLR